LHLDSTLGADARTGSAVYALHGYFGFAVLYPDCVGGANISASTASGTFISRNFKLHAIRQIISHALFIVNNYDDHEKFVFAVDPACGESLFLNRDL
jgi:hypothetical protein